MYNKVVAVANGRGSPRAVRCGVRIPWYDYSYDTDTECDDRAVDQLRKHDAAKRREEIETLPKVGLQPFDVVTVVDARAGACVKALSSCPRSRRATTLVG